MPEKKPEQTGLFHWLKGWFHQLSAGKSDRPPNVSSKVLIGLVSVGIGLMLVGQMMSPGLRPAAETAGSPRTSPASTSSESDPSLTSLETRLRNVLRQMAGVGEVEVMIVAHSSEKLVFADEVTSRRNRTSSKDPQRSEPISESREDHETRRPVVLRIDGGRNEEPVVAYRLEPDIAGVLVAAEGAKDERIRLEILEAVSTVLDVPAHRVQIVPLRK